MVTSCLSLDYGLTNARVQLVARHSFNSVFRVDVNGERYALRVGDGPRIHPAGIEDVEAAWLAALDRDGFRIASNVGTIAGDAWTMVDGQVCTLFHWLDGTELRKQVNVDSMREAGQLLAKLHDHADSSGLTAPAELWANEPIYFAAKDFVATYESVHASLFAEATLRVQELLDSLWLSPPHQPHLLHGDFGAHNVLIHRGHLTPLDFQDLRFGFDLQDVALSIADIGRNTPELVEPFRAGYSQVRPWPDLDPEAQATFAAARSLNIMNLGLCAPRTGIAAGFDRHAQSVVDWMTR